MKWVAAIIAVVVVTEARAGITYRFESVTQGLTSHTFSGTVKADRGGVRIDVASGDGMFFDDGSIILSSTGGRVVTVINPSKKTFYELDLENLLGHAAGALSQFRELVNVEAKNPRVAVRDAGAGGIVEGYATHRSHVVSSFDLLMKMFGEKTPARIDINTDVWSTDRFPAEFANVMQTSRLRTGIEAIDKLIESQTTSLRGFPLKQVTTTRMTTRGSTTSSTTTSRVTSIRPATVDAAEFVVPRGYRKVDNPVDSLLKGLPH